MSLKTSMRVWQHSETRGAMRCLMLAIADLANDDGIAWPGTAKLAEKINETPDYTDTLIKKCIDLGELAKISGRGRGHVTRFAVLCGLDTDAMKRLKGALQNPYSRAPFQEKGDPSAPIPEKRGTTKGVLASEKRGTFRNTKQSGSEATESAETQLLKNDTHHDPGGDHDHDHHHHEDSIDHVGGGGDFSNEKPNKTEAYHWLRANGVDSPQAAERNQHYELSAIQITHRRIVGDSVGDERRKRIGRFIKVLDADGPDKPKPAPPPTNSAQPPRPSPIAPDARPIAELAATLPPIPPWKKGLP